MGGITGGLIALAVVENVYFAAPILAPGISEEQGFLAEGIAAYLLVMVILGAGVSGAASHSAFLAIGLALGVGVLSIGPITNACINPARALAGAVAAEADDDFHYDWGDEGFWLYIIGPYLGAFLAAITWAFLFQRKNDASHGPYWQFWHWGSVKALLSND